MAGSFIDEYNALSARVVGLYGVAQSVGATASLPSDLNTYNLSGFIGSIPGYKHFTDYVQDGLVLGWDGIENAGVGTHASILSALYDHSGNGYAGVVYSQSGGGSMTPALSADVFNNGIHLEGQYPMIQAENTQEVLSAVANQEMTVEVLLERLDYDQDGRWAIWSCCAGDQWQGATMARTYFLNTNTPTYARWKNEYVYFGVQNSLPQYTMGTMTSVGKPRGYEQWLNGQLRTSYDQDNQNTTDAQAYFRIGGYGGRNSLQQSNFNFHCARVYNRILTPAEIAHNRAVDVARFNIQNQLSAI